MKTIKDDITTKKLKHIDKLKTLRMPNHLIDKMRKFWESEKVWDIKGMREFGSLEFESYEVRVGRGGKKYRVYKTDVGNILCFPQARYGIFITKER